MIIKSENTIIISKASVIFNNIGVLISVHLKGFQSIIECSEIRSNGSLLYYSMKEGMTYMPKKVFIHKAYRGDYTSPLRKKQKQGNVTTVLTQLLFDQRDWKTHRSFCGKVCVVDKKHSNRSKGCHKVGVFSFQISILNKCHERAENVKMKY